MKWMALSEKEAEALYTIYRRDVAVGWPWTEWARQCERTGEARMGFRWVLLPHKIDSGSPRIWHEVCGVYQKALEDHARQEYGLRMVLSDTGDRFLLEREEERVEVAA